MLNKKPQTIFNICYVDRIANAKINLNKKIGSDLLGVISYFFLNKSVPNKMLEIILYITRFSLKG